MEMNKKRPSSVAWRFVMFFTSHNRSVYAHTRKAGMTPPSADGLRNG